MGKPNHHYRENVDRAVYLNEVIDDALVRKLTPEILKLRSQSPDPITVYIDSPGGSLQDAETLKNLLTGPNADGQGFWIVTVVTGQASSAAADFLAGGQYAIAYPGTRIHCHGVRLPRMQELTMERASFAARMLREFNEDRAGAMARDIINRVIFNYNYLHSCQRFKEIRKEPEQDKLSDFDCFITCLKRRVSPSTLQIVQRARERFGEIQKISDHVMSRLKKRDVSKIGAVRFESLILHKIIQFEVFRNRNNEAWSLDDEGVARITEDFKLLKDYHTGEHTGWVAPVASRWAPFFLDEAEQAELKEFDSKPPEERNKWIYGKVAPRIWPIWYFTICIARVLQEAENPLTAEDAYWLGIVDEVLGSNLPCSRQILENIPEPDNGNSRKSTDVEPDKPVT